MEIFESGKIKNLGLRNKIIMAPMCMYESDDSGFVKPFHKAHYAARGYGGVALIIQEATAISKNGRISANDLGIWSDEQVEGLKELVAFVHTSGAKMGIQLGHSGRKCGVKNERLVAPSALAFNEKYEQPAALTVTEIKEIIKAFGNAAKRAVETGYDYIEVHAAHGYLINQFISPLTNKRDDEYGGSLANRTRFLKEILLEIRRYWQGPLAVRVSAEEYMEGGHHASDTVNVLKEVAMLIDIVNVSSGGVVPVVPEVYPGYQIPFAKVIKEAGFKVIGGGLIQNVELMNQLLKDETLDFIYLGRELLLNPYFVIKEAKKMNHEQALNAYKRGF